MRDMRIKTHRGRTISIPALLALFIGLTSMTAVAQSAYTPAKGSAERKAITDALRVPIEKKLKQNVVFKIDHLKIQDDWAFMLGAPRKTNGGQLDYSQSEYAEARRQGMFDDNIMALLQKVKGQWRVVQYIIGATDVAYLDWDEKYRAPSGIFPQ
jgi:hypothetical protein